MTSWRSVIEATAGELKTTRPASMSPSRSSRPRSPRSTACASSSPVNTLLMEPISNSGGAPEPGAAAGVASPACTRASWAFPSRQTPTAAWPCFSSPSATRAITAGSLARLKGCAHATGPRPVRPSASTDTHKKNPRIRL